MFLKNASDVGDTGKLSVESTARFILDDQGAFVLLSDRGMCLSLNRLGAKILHLVQDGNSREQILNTLTEHYPEITAEHLGIDLDLFLRDLVRKRVLRTGGTGRWQWFRRGPSKR